MHRVLRTAPDRARDAWHDESSGGIIFREMLRGDPEGTFAVSTSLTDDDHDVLVVDCEARAVGLAVAQNQRPLPVHAPWTFEEFLAFTEEELLNLEARCGAQATDAVEAAGGPGGSTRRPSPNAPGLEGTGRAEGEEAVNGKDQLVGCGGGGAEVAGYILNRIFLMRI